MTAKLRAGVIGAGAFGARHAARLAEMTDVDLVAINDTHRDRAEALATKVGAVAMDLGALLGAADIISIVSPAESHAAIAMHALDAVRGLYVEKPLALDLEAGDATAAKAARLGVPLACGFQERAALAGLALPAGPPARLEARRFGPPTGRALDVSVVLDLMIHDLDLARALGCGAPLAVEAEGSADEARAEVVFDTGAVATFAASRLAATRERGLFVAWPERESTIDLLAPGPDRLAASLAAFVACCRDERRKPLADAADGLAALDLALAVERALGR